MEKEYLTKEKFEEFKKELEYLRGEKRKQVAENLEYAKSLGDLSENAEYHEARDEQAAVEDRIAKLEALVKTASIMPEGGTTGVVSVGSVVTLERTKDSDTKVFTIVGTEESDVANGKISVKSPIGSTVLGKKKGEVFNVLTPKGSVEYKLISIK